MIPEIKETIDIPEGVEITIEEKLIKVKGPKGELERELNYPAVSITKEENQIKLSSKNATKREKRMIGTFKSHIKNMIEGIMEGYEYHLKVCSSHFPMTAAVEKNKVIIKNFLGEKIPREAKILENVTVKIDGSDITVTGFDKEKTGQTAANLEQACRIKRRDKRIFQDGVYITKKPGKEI